MDKSLSEHYTYKTLLRFTIPSVIMMIFTSIYGVIDGLFISNFAGKTPLAAINFIMPYLMILSAGGFMLGTGGNAYISKLLGEQNRERANSIFSMLIGVTVIGGLALCIIGQILLRPAAQLLGAQGKMLDNAVTYGRIVLLGGVPYMLQIEFQSLMPTAGKPHLGLAVTVAAGAANIVLDALFIGVCGFGLIGAAVATVCGMIIGGLVPIGYFLLHKNGSITLVKPQFDSRAFLKQSEQQ